jgi:micrococcal nuclease
MRGLPGWAGPIAVAAVVAALLLAGRGGSGKGSDEGLPESVTALVTRAVDGDTIEVRFGGEEEDVRYIGVDTPETVKPGAPVDCFGPRASHFNKALVTGERVRLVFGDELRDIYGRLLAYVYLNGRMINAELVRRGYARSLTIPPNDRYATLFRRAEHRAGVAGRGLWGACEP